MHKSRKIAIVGFGKEGLSAANFLAQDNLITVFDDRQKREIDPTLFKSVRAKHVNFCLGTNLPKDLKFDLVVRSPGVRPDHLLIKKLIKNGATLTSQIKIFFDRCPTKIIGVTGTKGKGTTATLIYEMLKCKYTSVFLAGNIGTPALDVLPKLTRKSLVVLELSSFQLFDLTKSPQIAVILMITSEHLDWHKDTKEYQKAKESVVRFQTKDDFAVINQDFEVARSFATKTRAKVFFVSTTDITNGVYVAGDIVISQVDKKRGEKEEIINTQDIFIPGIHNLQNVVAAVAVAKILKVDTHDIRKVLETFPGLPHRLQLVREIAGVKFYNDSFSTTPETTIAAIDTFPDPKILILGGSSKNSDFASLGRKITTDKSVKGLVLIGQERGRIKAAIDAAGTFGGKIKKAQNMREIVMIARSLAKSGDVIILSPACASFDMFKNYQDRGEQFTKEVGRQEP